MATQATTCSSIGESGVAKAVPNLPGLRRKPCKPSSGNDLHSRTIGQLEDFACEGASGLSVPAAVMCPCRATCNYLQDARLRMSSVSALRPEFACSARLHGSNLDSILVTVCTKKWA